MSLYMMHTSMMQLYSTQSTAILLACSSSSQPKIWVYASDAGMKRVCFFMPLIMVEYVYWSAVSPLARISLKREVASSYLLRLTLRSTSVL